MSFDDFIKDKTSKRSCNSEFKTKKTKKTKGINPDVTINIGQKMFVDGDFKTIWGKKLPVSVPRNATYALVLQKAIEKWKAFDRKFNGACNYTLLYEDGSYARFLPGSCKDFFDLEKYRTELGKDFKRITLFLCTHSDFELSEHYEQNLNQDNPDEDKVANVCKAEEDGVGFVNTDISTEEMQQIESDEKLAKTIQDQLYDDKSTEINLKCAEDLYDILVSKVDGDKQFFLVTRRKAPLARHLLLWQREARKNAPTSALKVHYVGEDGIDSGAMGKEFLENIVQEMKRVIFPKGSPLHSTFHVQNGDFRSCGEIAVTSIAQGGPTPCLLEPCAYDALWKDIDLVNICDKDLTNEEHTILGNVREDCTKHLDLILEHGYSGQISNDHIEEIINSLKVSFVNRRSLYMKEFKIGLNTYGLGDLISSYPDVCRPLFLQEFQAERVPDGNYLFSLLKPLYSPVSTSRRVVEESVMDHMQDLLMSLEDHKVIGRPAAVAWRGKEEVEAFSSSGDTDTTEETMEVADLSVAGVMGWLTGQKHKHSFGQKPTITIHFDHECLQRNPSHTVCYPLVGACGRDLTLPVSHMMSEKEFEDNFVTAFCMGQAFAKP